MSVLDPGTIGKRLQLLREAKALSQRDLARETGIAQSAISDYEKGRRLPTTKALGKLLQFFDIEAAELMSPPKTDPAEGKRRFLIRHIQDKLEDLPLEEISMVAGFVSRLVDYQKQLKEIRNSAGHSALSGFSQEAHAELGEPPPPDADSSA